MLRLLAFCLFLSLSLRPVSLFCPSSTTPLLIAELPFLFLGEDAGLRGGGSRLLRALLGVHYAGLSLLCFINMYAPSVF